MFSWGVIAVAEVELEAEFERDHVKMLRSDAIVEALRPSVGMTEDDTWLDCCRCYRVAIAIADADDNEIRNKSYRRMLVVAHPVFLFQDAGSRVETFAPDRPFRWLSLLYTNRQRDPLPERTFGSYPVAPWQRTRTKRPATSTRAPPISKA